MRSAKIGQMIPFIDSTYLILGYTDRSAATSLLRDLRIRGKSRDSGVRPGSCEALLHADTFAPGIPYTLELTDTWSEVVCCFPYKLDSDPSKSHSATVCVSIYKVLIIDPPR
jgi:hypothetical protein